MTEVAPLLSARDLRKEFRSDRLWGMAGASVITAVDGVSLDVLPGETFGLVGESGCGKSTLGRLLLGIIEPTGGTIAFDGVDTGLADKATRRMLRRSMQIIFQDPYSSLNPAFRVRDILWEGLRQVPDASREPATIRRARMVELLVQVGLSAAYLERYPHELSGGQRQRVGIARALTVSPRLIVADEPVSALDVSVQSQVLELFLDLQQRLGLTYVFISHDLSVVRYLCDRVAVMYLGRVIEDGPSDRLFAQPRHPYTQALLAAVPRIDAVKPAGRRLLAGELPSAGAIPPGCRYHPRCPFAVERCRLEDPALRPLATGVQAACHLAESIPDALFREPGPGDVTTVASA